MYGTFGPGPRPLAGEMYAEAAGARMTPVPYKGSAPLVTALIGGEVALGVDTVASAAPHAKAGKVRAGRHRRASLAAAAGRADLRRGRPARRVHGRMVRPGGAGEAPAPVLDTLGRAVEEVMRDPQVRKSIEDMAMEPVFMPGPAFRDPISSELATFGAVGKRAGITLD